MTIDAVSQALGNLDGRFEGLQKSFDVHCDADDYRHRENQNILKDINRTLTDLKDVLTPVAAAVSKMQPVVDDLAASKLKKMGAMGLAMTILTAAGFALLELGKALFGILFHH